MRKREEKWRKKNIYILVDQVFVVCVSTGVKWPCMGLRRRRDNVHSLAGVVLVYSSFFQPRIVWINRIVNTPLIEPFRTNVWFWRIAETTVSIRKCGRKKSNCFREWWWCFVWNYVTLRKRKLLDREAFQRMMVFCDVELSLLSCERER